jgi:ATP-dependent Lhr-like helicase
MEESGMIRRGMFVAGLGAAQFAMPAAVDMLRSLRTTQPKEPESVVLAATDPANPYGAILPWTKTEPEVPETSASHGMARTSGAVVVLINGQLAAFLRRKNPSIKVFLPENEPERSQVAARLARQLADLAVRRQQSRRSGLLISRIDDAPARGHFMARFLEEVGFVETATGYHMRRATTLSPTIAANTPEVESSVDSDADSDGDPDADESVEAELDSPEIT